MTRTMTITRTITIPDPIPVEGYREKTAKQMTERDLLANVTQAARLLGWLAYHTHISKHSESGFPDLILIERTDAEAARIIAAELKRESAGPSPAQVVWLDAFFDAGVETYLWRPSHWLSGEIESVLRGRS